MKNTLDLNLTPLHLEQVVYHWAIKAILYSILSTVVKGATNLETLQTMLNSCIPDKEIAKTHSQSSFIYFQSHLD